MLAVCNVFFFKQKTAYEMRISDWGSDVCSSDLGIARQLDRGVGLGAVVDAAQALQHSVIEGLHAEAQAVHAGGEVVLEAAVLGGAGIGFQRDLEPRREAQARAGALQERIDGLEIGRAPWREREWQ